MAVIGGGPAGLFVARLLRLAEPSTEVVVHERMKSATQTFGFGVGLTESTMRNLSSADPETAERIRAASHFGHELYLKGCDGVARLHGARNLAIGRAVLLEILTEAATNVGVAIHLGARVDVASLDADVIVAADGVGSATRRRYSADLGVHSALGHTRFVWCGTDFAVESAFFSAIERGESLFVAHVYPYASDRSTFLIEVDDITWRDSGLDELDLRVPAGRTDLASVSLLERVFADELNGHRLLSNRTRWSRFTDLALERWSVGNVVLIGDAAHTAHYTLGSGTKLALEDAIALAEAIAGCEGSPAEAFLEYEGARRPAIDRFKKLAHRSQAWWDSYRMRHHWPVAELAMSYMTRSGNLALRDYVEEQPLVAGRALTRLGRTVPEDPSLVEEWVLACPVFEGRLVLPRRCVTRSELDGACVVEQVEWDDFEVWGDVANSFIARHDTSHEVPLLICGPLTTDSQMRRIDLAERLRLEIGRMVGVLLPDDERSIAATAIAAGRADFVVTA